MNTQIKIVVTKEQFAASQNRACVACPIQYNPGNLLDALILHLGLKNDAALARALEIAPPMVSKIRHNALPVSGAMLIRMHEVSELAIRELRIFLGDESARFRMSSRISKQKIECSASLN